MRLADYIRENIDHLMAEWVDFARTRLPAADYVGSEALTNGSRELLLAIVNDLESAQSAADARAKSRGERDHVDLAGELVTSAEGHAKQRLKDGFTLAQLVSEYRALRASVIRCWSETWSPPHAGQIHDLVRFNEAMDQSLTEAIKWFSRGLEESRDIFVGMLGHDLRDPLNAASTAIQLQRQLGYDAELAQRTTDIALRSLDRISGMIDDLLDFARTRLAGPLELSPEPADMESICKEIRDEFAVARPDREIAAACSGNLAGKWDVERVKQLLANLVKNALTYGDKESPVTMSAEGLDGHVLLAVHNRGKPIPYEVQHTVFDPLVRGAVAGVNSEAHSMGLGLYIVRIVAEAHGGSVALESNERAGTTFSVTLPRDASEERP
ncbi:MAG TPA: sensor histidine kinase [Woeseiaceae bacterium]|nr:sensor histidine kinase [Woeseiaceae bacterium]